MSPQSQLADKDKGTTQDNVRQEQSAFSYLCEIASYYASTPPHQLKRDFKGDVTYLYKWRSEAKRLENSLNQEAKSEFRKKVIKTKPLVRKLWKALSKADKSDRRKDWDIFVDHVGDVNEVSEDLLDALDCP